MTEIIQERGGFVDKYIGDAIVAVFGAPFDDRDHAANAVRAALRCRERLGELNQTSAALRGHKLGQRIGLNSGDALVGNIGSRQRFNYTVMGDVVNLASRLEGANKYFGTSIVVSEATFKLAQTTCAWRELDIIRVQGRAEAVKIYEPLSLLGQATPEQTAAVEAYAAGLERWRAQDFAGAVSCLAPIAESTRRHRCCFAACGCPSPGHRRQVGMPSIRWTASSRSQSSDDVRARKRRRPAGRTAQRNHVAFGFADRRWDAGRLPPCR